MRLLHGLADEGYRNASLLVDYAQFANLRGEADYAELIERLQ